jgi:hypothetical protein
MAVEQKNFTLFTYTDNGGQLWNKRGELDTVRNAVDGSTAAGAHPNYGRSSRRHSPRAIIYRDLASTGRTKTVIFYTAAAFAAISLGTSTLTFFIEGSATGVTYTASKAVSERTPSATPPVFHLPEHP